MERTLHVCTHTHTNMHTHRRANTFSLTHSVTCADTFTCVSDPQLSCGIMGVWFVMSETVGQVQQPITVTVHTHTHTNTHTNTRHQMIKWSWRGLKGQYRLFEVGLYSVCNVLLWTGSAGFFFVIRIKKQYQFKFTLY